MCLGCNEIADMEVQDRSYENELAKRGKRVSILEGFENKDVSKGLTTEKPFENPFGYYFKEGYAPRNFCR